MATATKLRKNSKAKSWTNKKIVQLKREGYEPKQAVAVALSEARKYGLIKNSGEEIELRDELEDAQEVARGFHGRGNRETIDLDQFETYRENLAILGPMLDVEVFIPSREKEGLITLPFEDVMLTSSPDRKQLYLIGDTSLLDDWLEESVGNGWDKDKVSIGYVYSISYFADKHHLQGPQSQKKGSEYIHCFGEQTWEAPASFEGIWKLKEKIGDGLLPELIYSRLNCGMELVGGGYLVKDEGIWD